jgi:hypothetical protein
MASQTATNYHATSAFSAAPTVAEPLKADGSGGITFKAAAISDGALSLTKSTTNDTNTRVMAYHNFPASTAIDYSFKVGSRYSDSFPDRGASIRFTSAGTTDVFSGIGTAIEFWTHEYSIDNGKLAMKIGTSGNIAINKASPTAFFEIVNKFDIVTFLATAFPGQTLPLFQMKDSSGNIGFSLGPSGQIYTNQSAANTNTPSGATARQMPIYDEAGFLLGYIPIYASAW